jgi:hypothetical protein
MLRMFIIFIQPNVCLSYDHHGLSVDGVEVNLKIASLTEFIPCQVRSNISVFK